MRAGVELGQPLWLLVLPLVAVLLVLGRYPSWWAVRRHPGAARQEVRRLALRLAWTALVVLALADTRLIRYLPRQVVVLVEDVSASVMPARDEIERAAKTAAMHTRPGDLLGIVAAGAGAQLEEPPSETPLADRLGAAMRADGSDLASGIRLAGALVPEGYPGRVVLISDGQQTTGDAVAAARELAARGVSVDVLPLGTEGQDLALTRIQLPGTASIGEVSTLIATVEAPRASGATLRVLRDDSLLAERSLELRPGIQQVAIPVPVGEPGLHRYRVDIGTDDAAADGTPLNNSGELIQRVLGQPRVLVVAQSLQMAGWLPAALTAAGIEVTVARPESVPADLAGWARYDATVLADVPATSLPPGVMEQLEIFVRDLGRGLVMTGGPDAFGPGGYADTPVERALPVSMDIRGRGREPRVALALVIDKSGSMMGEKIEMAKEAAARSVRLLRPEDQAAILAFDSVPQWVSPLTPMSERDRLETAIGRIYADGGTDIYPALAVGFEALLDAPADVKHVILLTDGRSGTTGEYAALLDRMREARITLSTVGVGGDADTSLLEAMARLARGRYHFAANPRAIPQIFSADTLMATRTILVDDHFFAATASASPIVRGVGALPLLDGYVAATPKDRAEVVLVSPEGDPIAAAWQYGAGRAIAWTPDLGTRWSAAWGNNPSAAALWGNAFSWLRPGPESSELSVRVEPIDDRTAVILAENRAAWDEVRPTRATVTGPGGGSQDLDLQPAGPGRYRAEMAIPEAGAYVVRATQPLTAGEQRAEIGWVAPYPAEYRQTGLNRALLTRVAAAGGGLVLRDPADAMRPPDQPAATRWPAAGLLLVLAAIFWPLEIASRRLSVPPEATSFVASRLRLPVRSRPAGAPEPVVSNGRAAQPPPVATAERLLRRKQSFRDLRR